VRPTFVVAVVAASLSGCGAPAVPPAPTPTNDPVRIVFGSEMPSQVLTFGVGPNCKPLTFSVVVADRDPADRIRSLWFVDPNASFSTDPTVATPVTLSAGRAHVDMAFAADTPSLGTIGNHSMTVVVADGFFTTSDTGSHVGVEPRLVALPDGGIAELPIEPDSFTWLVQSRAASCP
jgi:hypothetical protein